MIAQKRVWWKKKDAGKFYDVHKDQPFFKDLISFMTSGPIGQVLEGRMPLSRTAGDGAPIHRRSARFDPQGFRRQLQRNSVHGSDGPDTAKREISLCFKKGEIVG